jgi:ribosomal protein L37AE/L43A
MTEKTVWECDGCDESIVVKGPTDWKAVDMTITGLTGFPTGGIFNGGAWHLCPSCQTRMVSMANPRKWPRVALR